MLMDLFLSHRLVARAEYIMLKREINLKFELDPFSPAREQCIRGQQGHLKVYISIQSSAAQVSPWGCY